MLILGSVFAGTRAAAQAEAATAPTVAAKPRLAALTLQDFDATVADALVGRLAEGISARSSRITLTVFDKSRSESFTRVREQLSDWFSQYRSIRLHYKIAQWSADGTIQTHFQIEQYPQTENFPAIRKDMDLTLHAERFKAGWRIVAFEPAEFFLP